MILSVREAHGGFYAHSPDMPGLSIWAASRVDLAARVSAGVDLMRKHAKGCK